MNYGKCQWREHTVWFSDACGDYPQPQFDRVCGVETRAHAKQWLYFCPKHWQALERKYKLGLQQIRAAERFGRG